jgi:hypothetical protein
MSQVIPFQFAGTLTVRSLLINDAPWFVAGDVCKALEIQNVSQALGQLDPDEQIEHIQYIGSGRKPKLINESGLYSLILRSRKPEAKSFKRWVTSEVLPALRRTGTYSVARREPTGAEIQADNAGRGSLEAQFYPPFPLSASDLKPLTKAEVTELSRACGAVASNFRFDHKANYALRRKIDRSFGGLLSDLEHWQFADVRKFIDDCEQKAKQFREQCDSLENLFWEKVTYNREVAVDLGKGQVFALK